MITQVVLSYYSGIFYGYFVSDLVLLRHSRMRTSVRTHNYLGIVGCSPRLWRAPAVPAACFPLPRRSPETRPACWSFDGIASSRSCCKWRFFDADDILDDLKAVGMELSLRERREVLKVPASVCEHHGRGPSELCMEQTSDLTRQCQASDTER